MRDVTRHVLPTILLCLLLSSPVFADEVGFECTDSVANERGVELLRQAQNAYAGITSLKAQFVQRAYLAALDVTEISSGMVYFDRQGLMKWSYFDPEEQIFVLREDTFWFYQKELEQVVIDLVSSSLRSELPVAFLLGIGKLEEDFELLNACATDGGYLLNLKEAHRGGMQVQIKDSEPLTLSLLIDRAAHLPLGATIYDTAGNKNSFIFSDRNFSKSRLDPETFEVRWPDGTDVHDRRFSQPSEVKDEMNQP